MRDAVVDLQLERVLLGAHPTLQVGGQAPSRSLAEERVRFGHQWVLLAAVRTDEHHNQSTGAFVSRESRQMGSGLRILDVDVTPAI